MVKIIVPCVAIICITALEIYAISKGINGVMLTGVIAAITGIGGYQMHKIKSNP